MVGGDSCKLIKCGRRNNEGFRGIPSPALELTGSPPGFSRLSSGKLLVTSSRLAAEGVSMSSRPKDDPKEMAELEAWLLAVANEIGVDPSSLPEVQPRMLDLVREIAHGPTRPGGPMTCYLIGLASVQQDKPALELVEQVSEMIPPYMAELDEK